MGDNQTEATGPDLTLGLSLSELPDGGKLVGHAGGDQILLVRQGAEIFAVGAQCTHYHGPLMDGLVVGINTFILSEGGGSEGLGFAIPYPFRGPPPCR